MNLAECTRNLAAKKSPSNGISNRISIAHSSTGKRNGRKQPSRRTASRSIIFSESSDFSSPPGPRNRKRGSKFTRFHPSNGQSNPNWTETTTRNQEGKARRQLTHPTMYGLAEPSTGKSTTPATPPSSPLLELRCRAQSRRFSSSRATPLCGTARCSASAAGSNGTEAAAAAPAPRSAATATAATTATATSGGLIGAGGCCGRGDVAGPDTRRGEKESERVVARRLRVCGRSQICGSLFFALSSSEDPLICWRRRI